VASTPSLVGEGGGTAYCGLIRDPSAPRTGLEAAGPRCEPSVQPRRSQWSLVQIGGPQPLAGKQTFWISV
jgi:hypothetical protein